MVVVVALAACSGGSAATDTTAPEATTTTASDPRNCDPTELKTEATVAADGSMEVIEHLTFEFAPGCHGGIRSIDPPAEPGLGATDYTIGRIVVTENGEPVPIAEERRGYVRWGDVDVEVEGHHEYDVTYRVRNAVSVAPDVAVLYWAFVGTKFPELAVVDVTVHMPGDGTGLRAFMHGVPHGRSRIDGADVSLHVDVNPAGEIVEVRTLQPATDFTVAPTGPPIEADIVAEEEEFG